MLKIIHVSDKFSLHMKVNGVEEETIITVQ